MEIRSFTLILFLLASEIQAIDFFYTIEKNIDNCFEDHLSDNIFMTGEIYFDGNANITMTIENPFAFIILTKV